MYYAMLASGNTEFSAAVKRGVFHATSSKLSAVLTALEVAQRQKNGITLRGLLEALHNWRQHEAREYSQRGLVNGAAYRLWMETKQALRNRFNGGLHLQDPPIPAGCPGTTLLNVYVPPGAHNEICHNFAYRWAIAAGKINEDPVRPATSDDNVNADTMTPVLYPLGLTHYPSARVNGVLSILPGDIICMYTVANNGAAFLGHSLIAKTSSEWFSANNVGTFGNVGTGRSEINTNDNFGVVPVQSKNKIDQITGQLIGSKHTDAVGWTGDNNLWVRQADGESVHVVYRR